MCKYNLSVQWLPIFYGKSSDFCALIYYHSSLFTNSYKKCMRYIKYWIIKIITQFDNPIFNSTKLQFLISDLFDDNDDIRPIGKYLRMLFPFSCSSFFVSHIKISYFVQFFMLWNLKQPCTPEDIQKYIYIEYLNTLIIPSLLHFLSSAYLWKIN